MVDPLVPIWYMFLLTLRCALFSFAFLSGQVHPTLYESVQYIFCQYVETQTLKDELLMNFKNSIKGSLRKAPSIMCWVQAVQNLMVFGKVDVQALIKKFNSQNP